MILVIFTFSHISASFSLLFYFLCHSIIFYLTLHALLLSPQSAHCFYSSHTLSSSPPSPAHHTEDGTVVMMTGHRQPVVGVEAGLRSPMVLTYNHQEVLWWSWPSMVLTNRLRQQDLPSIIWVRVILVLIMNKMIITVLDKNDDS